MVLAQPQDGTLRYQPVNACIRLLPTVDGCQVLTVEDLGQAGALHPVQQAVCDAHGSQCGFCTPGFVMSLFALYRSGASIDRVVTEDALAGNLCRCTGYGPLIDAAGRMTAEATPDRFTQTEAETMRRLAPLKDGRTIAVEAPDGSRWFAPTTIDALAELVASYPHATLIAGATDVGLWVTKQLRRFPVAIFLGRVVELGEIRDTGDAIEIGAGVSVADAAAPLAALYPDLGELFRRFASTQIRASATLGGNVANGSPIGDGSPALIAADARVVLRRGGERREIPIEAFFLEYGRQDREIGEFLERIIVPRPPEGARLAAYKISKRFDQDISALCAVFRLVVRDGHVAELCAAFGGLAGVPKRASALEAALVGQAWNADSVEAAIPALAQDFTPLTDLRASANYRATVAGNLVRKFLIETTDPAVPTRLLDRRRAHA